MAAYPEHEKLELVQEESQACGAFLDWLMGEKGYFLALYDEKQEKCRNCEHPDPHDERVADPVMFGQRACSFEDDEDGALCDCDTADFGNPNRRYVAEFGISALLAEFFGIDRRKLEEEKRQMLAELREANA